VLLYRETADSCQGILGNFRQIPVKIFYPSLFSQALSRCRIVVTGFPYGLLPPIPQPGLEHSPDLIRRHAPLPGAFYDKNLSRD
jgi:hypothetical protein